MDIHKDIAKWLREMGYNGQIPENLTSICNNSTKFIWEQLMQNVRPKQEVEKIRKNIILNRLKAKPLDKQDEFPYKIKEIEEYKKKVELDQKLKLMREMVEEKRHKVNQLAQKCKMKDVSVDFLKKKISENEQRKYLLDSKKKQLDLQTLQAEDTLNKLRSVSPVEREETAKAKEIRETLENCAGKLNKLLQENQTAVALKMQKPSSSFTVKKKVPLNESSVASYLSIQEKKDFEEITRSCQKQMKDKENRDCNIQNDDRKKIQNRSFFMPQIIVEDCEKNSFEQLGVGILSFDSGSKDMSSPGERQAKKRESLGLLPDSCFNQISNNDSFLQLDKNELDSVFNETLTTSPRSENSDSIEFKFKVPEIKKPKKSTKNEVQNLLYSDLTVNRELEKLLHGKNREFIYETLQKCIHDVEVEFIKIVSMDKAADDRKRKIDEDDLAKLGFVHVQTELKIIQQKKVLKDLITKIGKRKLQILSSVKSKDNMQKVQEWLEANIKQVALDASLEAMKKEINSSKIVETDDNDLKVLLKRIANMKEGIATKMQLIQLTIDDLYNTHQLMVSTRESVLSPIYHIEILKADTDWMNPLLEDIWGEEMRVFQRFPLEYQRRCIYIESKTFYRDLCIDNYPQDTQIDQDDLTMLTEILESPFNPPETILLNIMKAKMKMDVLKAIKTNRQWTNGLQDYKKYSFEELQQQESYLEYAIDRLKSLMFSSNSSKTLSIGDTVKQAMEIWMDMPMKEFISGKRLLEGQRFQFYQNKLKCLL